MKKAIAVFLCIMLTTGMISGCAGREQGADSSGENTAAEENKEDQDAQTEEGQETEEEAGEDGQKSEEQDQQETDAEETDGSQEETQDRDMTEDLAMSVLKDQAGTVDYTSLEELNPEPGIRIAVVLKQSSAASGPQ